MILGLAIVGCGNWGPKLLRHFSSSPRFRLEAAVDVDPARREAMRAAYPALKVSADLEDAFGPDVGLVVLATPPDTHHGLGMRILEAGKHLLVEKPMALTSSQCRELNALAARKGLKVLVDHTMLFHPAVEFMRKSLGEGGLGTPEYLEAARINAPAQGAAAQGGPEGVNVLWDLAPHDFSIADYLFGGGPATVSAKGSGRSGPAEEDDAEVTFTYSSGLVCRFRFNRLAPERVRRAELAGSRQRILFDDGEEIEKVRVYAVASRAASVPELPAERPLGKLVDHVWQVLAQDAPTPIGGDGGERIVGLVEAVQASLERQGLPVAVG
jgi:predicted dehydrogenase